MGKLTKRQGEQWIENQKTTKVSNGSSSVEPAASPVAENQNGKPITSPVAENQESIKVSNGSSSGESATGPVAEKQESVRMICGSSSSESASKPIAENQNGEQAASHVAENKKRAKVSSRSSSGEPAVCPVAKNQEVRSDSLDEGSLGGIIQPAVRAKRLKKKIMKKHLHKIDKKEEQIMRKQIIAFQIVN